MYKLFHSLFLLLIPSIIFSQNTSIGNFMSVEPAVQDAQMHIPPTHVFQVIVEQNDLLTSGESMHNNFDFTGYVPINQSSTNGYLSINGENTPGHVAIFDFQLDTNLKKWNHSNSQEVDFTPWGETARNCSGAVTPWNTIISCEESVNTNDVNNDGYHDYGWAVEIDPVTRTVIDKRWALGKFKHENLACHPNQRTFYQGADSNPGYLYKFVADQAADLSSGDLFVYVGPKNGNGNWVQIPNTTIAERNNTLTASADAGGTVFNSIEDLEIAQDGTIYMAVKNERCVYRFEDSSLLSGGTVNNFEIFVGGFNVSYDIYHPNGVTNTDWGTGNDNLTFDNAGNLWVLQDGSNDHVWIVRPWHTAANPAVGLFMRSPAGSEPTGMTFTPDNKYMFMSFQHPASANSASSQLDAFGNPQFMDKDVAIVVALDQDLGDYSDNCLNTLTISNPQILTNYFQAKVWIHSNGVVQPNEQVDFRAGDYIDLLPDFEVELGADFSAEIKDCNLVSP